MSNPLRIQVFLMTLSAADFGVSYELPLVNGEEPFPEVTTNAAENAFSRMDLRLKDLRVPSSASLASCGLEPWWHTA